MGCEFAELCYVLTSISAWILSGVMHSAVKSEVALHSLQCSRPLVTVRHNTGMTVSSCAVIEASHSVCYSAQHLEKTFISAKQDTSCRPLLAFSGRTCGKAEGQSRTIYLGYNIETEAAAALSGGEKLL